MKTIALSLCFLGLIGCVKKTETSANPGTTPDASRLSKSPEEVVRQFIEISASAKDEADRTKLADLCMGEMRRTLERMTPEAFRIAYLNNNVDLKNVRVLENATEAEKSKIRYQVTIDNKQGTDPTAESNEREVELAKVQGGWYIETIRPKGSDKIAFTRGMIF